MYVTEVTKDDELDTAATGFATACVLNGTGLHLTLPENGEITNAAADFHTKLQAVYAAKLALHNAIQAKDAQKAATRGVIAKWAKTFRADPTISDALLAAVNVAPHSPSRVKPAAATPSGLVGTIDGAGAVRLAWLRGTNKYPTTFIVEKQSAPDGNWVLCGTTTRLEFETTTTVGDYAAYRVTAMRRGTVSAPSTPFGFYFTTPALHLAA
jgi:hypothetical protein